MVEGAERETQRLERQFAEEYKARGRHLASVVTESVDAPLTLANIQISGSKHTRPGFLQSVCSPYLPKPGQETLPLGEVLKRTRDLCDALRSFDIFKSVDAGLDEARDLAAQPGDVDLHVKVQEKGRLFLKTSTDVGNGEGSATVTGRVRNLFGGAETLEAYAAYGTRTKSAYHLSFLSPLSILGLTHPSSTQMAEVTAFAMQRDLTTFASCKENLQGLAAKIRLGAAWPGWSGDFGYEATARSLSDFEPFASIAMRMSAGAHLRSALVSRLSYDNTDQLSPIPRFGLRSNLSTEFAGLGGDAQHLKLSSSTTSYYTLSRIKDIFCSFSVQSGLLLPLSSSTPTHFCDRFRLGGPTSVRAFKFNQLGPKEHVDYIGGELSYAIGSSLYAPLPFKPEWPLQTHLWVNAGNLTNWSGSARSTIQQWITRPSVSAGLGALYCNGALRAELNFGVPLVAHKGDGKGPGLQLGIGIEFL